MVEIVEIWVGVIPVGDKMQVSIALPFKLKLSIRILSIGYSVNGVNTPKIPNYNFSPPSKMFPIRTFILLST